MITIFVPAYNEEKRLSGTMELLFECAKAEKVKDFEVIIVDDGSRDKTLSVAKEWAARHSSVRVVEHRKNQGIGAGFIKAIKLAKYDRISLYPADGAVTEHSMRTLFRYCHSADVVGVFTVNADSRSPLRVALSQIFTLIYTTSFALNLKYINMTPVYPVNTLRKIKLKGLRYSILPEINIKLLRRGATFLELEGYTNPQQRSSALRLTNLIEVVRTYLGLLLDVYVFHPKTYSRRPERVLLKSRDDIPKKMS